MMLRLLIIPLVALVAVGCSQSIAPQGSADVTPADFFWTRAALRASVNYHITRNGATTVHPIYSQDSVHVLDGSINKTAFRILSMGDTIAIDSLGANTIFSLPAGYYFAKDTTKEITGDSVRLTGFDTVRNKVNDSIIAINPHYDTTQYSTTATLQIGGDLKLLERVHLDSGASWQAGVLAGPGLGTGVSIVGRVLDHVTTLIDSLGNNTYGESYVVRYSHEDIAGTMAASFPLFWKVYYSRGVGPVLIEEYTNSYTPAELQSRAILEAK